jgi:large subunit ribosomal protein L18
MSKVLEKKLDHRAQRRRRVHAVVRGTAVRPRLSVFISSRHITAQLIDDDKGVTLGYATTVGQKGITGTMTERASTVGQAIAKQAKGKKLKSVVFDRGGRLYHGRVAALADAARKEGLIF